MWEQSYSKEFKNVKSETIWKILTDVNQWPTWHSDLDSCTMQDAFQVGNHFMLKPKGARPVKIVLTEVIPGKSFTDCTSFPGAKMYDTHILEQTKDGVIISNHIKVTGLLSWLWVKLVARNVANTVPDEIELLVQLARSKDG